jgi:FkbM family methyltransferase
MREVLWLHLRQSTTLRRLYAYPALAGLIRAVSYLLVPSIGQRRLRVRTGPGKGLLFDLNPRWEHTAWEGTYEMSLQLLFVKFLTPGAIVFDVGANYGFYSLLAARKGVQVWAFEPDNQNAKALAYHAHLNGLEDKIRIITSAVFSYDGNIVLEPSDQTSAHGNAHTRPQPPCSSNSLQVPCITLDDFIQSNPQPTLVKIDVEGGESEVLKGADHMFRTSRPYLLCEIHDDSNACFTEKWLKERSYNCRWLGEDVSYPRHLFASPSENR